jgi:hypothetical protein
MPVGFYKAVGMSMDTARKAANAQNTISIEIQRYTNALGPLLPSRLPLEEVKIQSVL